MHIKCIILPSPIRNQGILAFFVPFFIQKITSLLSGRDVFPHASLTSFPVICSGTNANTRVCANVAAISFSIYAVSEVNLSLRILLLIFLLQTSHANQNYAASARFPCPNRALPKAHLKYILLICQWLPLKYTPLQD